jgi:hypothetical protein
LTSELDKLKEIYGGLEPLVAPTVSQKNIDPLYFKEMLIQTQRQLRNEARNKNIALPETLGFQEYELRLSEPGDLPELVNKLSILQELVYMAIGADVKNVTKIGFDDFDEEQSRRDRLRRRSRRKAKSAGEDEDTAYKKVPINFTVNCSIKELLDILYKFRASSHNLVIHKLVVTSSGMTQTASGGNESMLEAKFQMHSIFMR